MSLSKKDVVLECIKQAGKNGITMAAIRAKTGFCYTDICRLLRNALIYEDEEQTGKYNHRYFYAGFKEEEMKTYICVPDLRKIPHRIKTREARGMTEVAKILECSIVKVGDLIKNGRSYNGYFIDELED